MKVVLAGTVLWVVALLVLLFLGDRVDRTWIWTCVCGIVLAGLGLALMRWQGQLGSRRGGTDGDPAGGRVASDMRTPRGRRDRDD